MEKAEQEQPGNNPVSKVSSIKHSTLRGRSNKVKREAMPQSPRRLLFHVCKMFFHPTSFNNF